MTSIFRRIDDFMFDRVFQPIVDRFPDQGPVGVARFLISGVAVAFVASATAYFSSGSYVNGFCALVFVCLAAAEYFVAGWFKPRIGVRNYFRLSRLSARAFYFIFTLGFALLTTESCNLGNAGYCGGLGLYACFEYAQACDIHPPKTRKAPFWQSIFQSSPQGA